MQSPRAAGRVPGPGNEMLAVGDTSSSATSAPGGKKLYQEEDIGKLAVLGREHPADSGVATKFAMCVAAASVAEFATYPLDLTKTRCRVCFLIMHKCILQSCTFSRFRLQIQGEVRSQGGQAPVKYRGMIQTALGIAREEVSSGQHSALQSAVCMIVCTAMHDTAASRRSFTITCQHSILHPFLLHIYYLLRLLGFCDT